MINKKLGILLVILVFTTVLKKSPQFVYADGSLDPQDVIVSYSYANLYPDNCDTSMESSLTIEDYMLGSEFTLLGSDPENWSFNITDIDYYTSESGTSGTNELQGLIYKAETGTDPSDLFGSTGEVLKPYLGSGSSWWSFPSFSEIQIPLGETEFWVALWMDSGSGDWNMGRDTTGSDGESISKSEAYTPPNPSPPDPLTGESSSTTYAWMIRVDLDALKETNTSYNQFWGNSTHYTARRDYNASFPGSAANRIIQITYPYTEYILNISYPTLALNASDYTNEVYNSTHRIITIPEATIASFGTDYRIFTEAYPYVYNLYGLYYGNGTFSGALNVTAHKIEESDIFEVNRTFAYPSNERVLMFSFDVGAQVRRIYTLTTAEDIYLFYPESPSYLYEFEINDYTGQVGVQECYLEARRSINGTLHLTERMRIADVINDVPLTLSYGKVYKLQIYFSDTTTYDFGYYIAGVDATPILALTEMEFGDQAHTVYQYILAEATRPNATHISMSYEDDTPNYDTIRVNFTVEYRNGTQVYNSSVASSQSVTFNWYGAENETDYVVELWADHQYHGEIRQKWVLDYSRTFETFPDLDVLGTWPFPSQNLFSLFISLIVAGLFSFGSMTLAPFIFMTFLSAFTYLGAATFTYTQLAIGFSLSIIFALAYRGTH